jgi:anti-anti-sigma factor
METQRIDPSPEPSQDQLFVATTDQVGLARIHGRGSFQVSPSLKQFAQRMLDDGKQQIVVDLKHCEGMDSTFMGTLAGISQRFQKSGRQPVVMTGVSAKLSQLMKTLGLDRVVSIQKASWEPSPDEAPEVKEEAPAPPTSTLRSAEHILEAHETLVEISPANLSKFKDCLAFLREEVGSQEA